MKKAPMFFCVAAVLGIMAGSVCAKPLAKGQRRGVQPKTVAIADPYTEAVDGILNAIAEKEEALARIDAAIEQEEAVARALNSTKKSRGFDDLKPRDILKSAANIRRSAKRQKKIKRDLVKSIKGLKKSLDLLGWEGPVSPEPVAHCGFIVSFKSIEPFEPRTPKELLNSFTERHWQGARTHHFRTRIQGGKLTGHICVDNDADKKSLAAALERSDKLTLVKIRAVTQKEFEEHCRLGQPSLPPAANSIGMEFVSIPAGEWQAVDFVKEIEYFKPGKKQWTSDLYLKGLTFYKDGTTSGPWTWEKGWLRHPGDKTKARYVIKEIDGSSYLFMEWISGDVTIRRQKPRYYVMQKVVDNDTASISGLIAYWKFDEGDGKTAYDSVGKNHGNIHGAKWTTGQAGGALSFDGQNDYVSGSTSPFDFANTTFTASAWFKKLNAEQGVIVSEGGKSSGWRLATNASGQIFVHLKKSNSYDAYIARTTDAYAGGQWRHVAAVITTDTSGSSGNNADIYVDGNLVDVTHNKIGPYGASTTGWTIGTREAGHSNFFKGMIDDVRIYDRALDSDEVASLADVDPSLVAHWTFDDNLNDHALDNDGIGHQMGTGVTYVDGVFGKACDFNGVGSWHGVEPSSFIEIDGSGTYNEYSISVWFKTGNDNYWAFFSNAHGAGSHTHGRPEMGTYGGKVYVVGSDTGRPGSELRLFSRSGYGDDQWHHAVGIGDSVSNVVELYVDGKYVGLNGLSDVYPLILDNGGTPDTRCEIGARSRKKKYYVGQVDDVRIYSKKISASKVRQLYAAGSR